MARIYVGNTSKVDQEILEAVKSLPDDFWVFAEFDIDRNIDWFICREVSERDDPEKLSVMIVTELKRTQRPLRGADNGPWSMLTEGEGWQPIRPSHEGDVNYYFQAINAANALAEWLWNNQRRYLLGMDAPPRDEFKVWPDLLILSPAGTVHQLPLGPSSRYGRWLFSVSEWLSQIRTWDPKKGIRLNGAQLAALAEVLGLEQVWPKNGAPQAAQATVGRAALDFVGWLQQLEGRIIQMEQRLNRLAFEAEQRSSAAMMAPAPLAIAEFVRRPWTDDEKQALKAAIADIRQQGRSRALPAILEMMNMHLGYRLQDTQYNGFLSARAMFEQARSETLIHYGLPSGPNPTVYLADE